MRREDRERSFGEENPQHSSNREKEGTRPSRPVSGDERIKGGMASDEPQKMPSSQRQSGRLPLPD